VKEGIASLEVLKKAARERGAAGKVYIAQQVWQEEG